MVGISSGIEYPKAGFLSVVSLSWYNVNSFATLRRKKLLKISKFQGMPWTILFYFLDYISVLISVSRISKDGNGERIKLNFSPSTQKTLSGPQEHDLRRLYVQQERCKFESKRYFSVQLFYFFENALALADLGGDQG